MLDGDLIDRIFECLKKKQEVLKKLSGKMEFFNQLKDLGLYLFVNPLKLSGKYTYHLL